MTSNRARQLKRERRQVQRKRAASEAVARETQHQQAVAAAKTDWSHRGRRHTIAFVMYAVAAVIAVGHVFEHFGTINLMSAGLEDLLIGWPIAALMALVGAIVYGT